MVKKDRLIEPTDDFVSGFPNAGFCNRKVLQTNGEPILVCDPTYIADVYNSQDDVAAYIRAYGVFLMEFGGDASCPIWWKPPFILLPLSMHLDGDVKMPDDVEVWVNEIGTDSGSFVFLPLSDGLPEKLMSAVLVQVELGNAALLPVPSGSWTAMYEQFDAPQANMRQLYRNIVIVHSGGPS